MIGIIAALLAFVMTRLNKILTATTPLPQKTWLAEYMYAHRGLHDEKTPENSLAAFENAAKSGYAIELDVRLSKDGRVVVFHDGDTMRMTGTCVKVKDITFEELRRQDIGGGQRIPSLEEVLTLVNGRVPVLIELKNKWVAGDLEKSVYRLLQDYHGKYAVQSFSPFSVRWFKKNAPHVYRGQLACDFLQCEENFSNLKKFLIARLFVVIKKLKMNFICKPNFISYQLRGVNTKLLQRLRKSGATVLAWTVRNEEQFLGAYPYTDSVIFENFIPSRKDGGADEA